TPVAQPQLPVVIQQPPVVVQPPAVVTQPPPAPLPADQPPVRPPQRRPAGTAVPESAPPSERGPVVPPTRPTMPPAPGSSTSMKVDQPRYSDYSGGAKADSARGGCAVTFWNLTDNQVTLRAGGQTRSLPRGRSVTLPMTRDFVWQVNRRAERTGQVPPEESTLTVLIRR